MANSASYREAKEVTYPNPKAFEKGKRKEAKNGWIVDHTVELKVKRSLSKRLSMGLLFHKLFPPKPKLVVTYAREHRG